jgi:mannosyltransferase
VVRRREVWPSRWTGLLIGFCLAGILVLVLHAPILPSLIAGTVGSERDATTVKAWTNPVWTVIEFVRGMRISFAGGVAAISAVLVFGVGFISYVRTKPVLVVLMLVPVIVGAAVIVGLGRYLRPRFFFFAVGFGALMAVRGAMLLGVIAGRLLRRSRVGLPWLGTALSAALVLVSAMSIPFAYGPKQDYAGALAYVQAERRPGDAVTTVGLTTFPYHRYYVLDWQEAETLGELNAIRAQSARTWLVYTLPDYLESLYPEIMMSIQREFKLVRPFYGTLGGGTIFVCRSDVPPGDPP